MVARRFYVYRNGSTSACALTAVKGDAGLPVVPDGWRFWMQIGVLQAENGRFGVNIRSAINEIATQGYCLFTGTRQLLGKDVKET